jgi:hypothetical protein
MQYVSCDGDDYSIHAERLESGCRGFPATDWQRSFSEGRSALCNYEKKTAMSIRYGVFVSTALLTFELASTVFCCRGRAARCVMQGPTVPGTARGTNHVGCFQERRHYGWEN